MSLRAASRRAPHWVIAPIGRIMFIGRIRRMKSDDFFLAPETRLKYHAGHRVTPTRSAGGAKSVYRSRPVDGVSIWEVPTMTRSEPDTEELLDRAGGGDRTARDALLRRHRRRLSRMVAVRMDPRLAARLDPSDVVQETLAEADRRLDGYLRDRPLPFYPWLRQIAADRLADEHRRHVRAGKRTVTREEPAPVGLPGRSAVELAERLFAPSEHPSEGMRAAELAERVRSALAALPGRDREVLVLRHLEQLSAREVAAVLGTTEGAAKARALRALKRLRDLLRNGNPGGRP
jgi:RNA polymerase sigma-70 factor (ECF subfamily)